MSKHAKSHLRAADAQDVSGRAMVGRLMRDWVSPYWPIIALNFVAIAAFAATDAAYALIIKYIYEAFEAKDMAIIGYAPILVIGATAVRGVSLYSHKVLTNMLLTRVEANLKIAMYHKMVDADMAWLAREAPASLAARLQADIDLIRQSIERLVNNVLRDLLRVIALFATMLYIDWRMTLLAMIVFPIAIWPIAAIGQRLRKISKSTQEQVGKMTALVQESLAGVRMAKTYRIERYLKDKTSGVFEQLRALKLTAAQQHARIDPILEALGGVAVAAVVYFVGARIAQGQNTLGDFTGFIGALLMAAQPMRGLGNVNAVVQQGIAAMHRTFEILDEPPKVVDAPNAKPLQISQGAVSFQDVSFGYGDEGLALSGLNLSIPGGARAALVGRSGAGKSTVFNLAPRLYDVTSGAVLIDGQDVRDVSVESLRAGVALVAQDAVLFNDTIRANIAFGRPGASDAEIEAAARNAAAHDFIMALPQGYDTPVGERGERLSGGQRQRVSIARAFLRDAPILLLDEATSALDAESEAEIKAALDRLAKGRTTIVIAHRLSTILDADVIVVMEKGQVAEIGRHEALVAQKGIYASLYKLQFEGRGD